MLRNKYIYILLFAGFCYTQTGIFSSGEKANVGVWAGISDNFLGFNNNNHSFASFEYFSPNNIELSFTQFEGRIENKTFKISYYFLNKFIISYSKTHKIGFGDDPQNYSIGWYNKNGFLIELSNLKIDYLNLYDEYGNNFHMALDDSKEYFSIGKYFKIRRIILGIEYKNALENIDKSLQDGIFTFRVGSIL